MSSPQITNAIFAGNTGRRSGGAIFNGGGSSGTSSPQITNATFTGNTASSGGAIFNTGSFGGASRPLITNTILWGNTADNGGNDIVNDDATPEYRHTLAEGLDLTGTGTGNVDGTDPASDPLFVDAGDFSGPDNTCSAPPTTACASRWQARPWAPAPTPRLRRAASPRASPPTSPARLASKTAPSTSALMKAPLPAPPQKR